MKVIYDTKQPQEKRVEFIGNNGESYFGYHCFQIKLSDGIEEAVIGNWGKTQKERNSIVQEIKNRGKLSAKEES